MLYNIYHNYDVDGGFGDAVPASELVGTVEATPEEIAEFLKVWDKPRIYERPYSCLYHHGISAEPVTPVVVADLKTFQPYDPYDREWPDLPEGRSASDKYNPDTGEWEKRVWQL